MHSRRSALEITNWNITWRISEDRRISALVKDMIVSLDSLDVDEGAKTSRVSVAVHPSFARTMMPALDSSHTRACSSKVKLNKTAEYDI
jgi:hypothetical protein